MAWRRLSLRRSSQDIGGSRVDYAAGGKFSIHDTLLASHVKLRGMCRFSGRAGKQTTLQPGAGVAQPATTLRGSASTAPDLNYHHQADPSSGFTTQQVTTVVGKASTAPARRRSTTVQAAR